jgi:prevent-host-death family protein
MKTVKISEFKAHLSAHLRVASQGEEILVCDRNRPIARLVPAGVLDARAERLMARAS